MLFGVAAEWPRAARARLPKHRRGDEHPRIRKDTATWQHFCTDCRNSIELPGVTFRSRSSGLPVSWATLRANRHSSPLYLSRAIGIPWLGLHYFPHQDLEGDYRPTAVRDGYP
jgi:hypothetical protein